MNNTLKNISHLEYGFFVKETMDNYNQKNGAKNDFKNWELGLADMRFCKVISVTKKTLEFLAVATL